MIRALTLILIMIGTSASAQTLPVRSGEHEGYTRLVIQVPAGTGWTLTTRKNGADLNIAIEGVTFDTNAVFDRLSGDRLQSLSQSKLGTALQMAFGCECVATAFLHRQTMVVVDIAPGKFTPPADPNANLVPVPPPAFAKPAPLQEGIPATELALPLLRLNQRNFEDRLISRILQSADREVVDLSLAGVGRRHSTRFGPLREADQPAPNLRLSSVLDNAQGLENLALPQFKTGPECVTDRELEFETWASSDPFAVQVAASRTGLFQEFDRIDHARALKLAKLYTYHGFGVEAIQVLNLLPDATVEESRILVMASTLDGLILPEPNPFADQQSCEGSAALWALLTEGKLHPDARLNAIEQTFSRFPKHLRRQLGPMLADVLVAAGKLEASRRILRSVERILVTDTADMTLAKATIADAAGNADTAETLLVEVTTAPNAAQEAPLALARLIEKRWSDRGAISPGDLDLAAGYARELRKSELGPMMARSHVLALAMSQGFDDALRQIESAPDDLDWQRTRNQILHLLAERADDITFLRYVLGLKVKTRDVLTVETATSLAERLVDLGFSTPAYELTNRPHDQTQTAERARIRARTAMLNDRPRQALLELANDSSEAARTLRAQALMQAQNYDAAADMFREIGKTKAADRLSWLAGSNGVDTESTNAFTDLSRINISLERPVDRQLDRPLADANKLLMESASARAQIADMFEIVHMGELN
ncbi:hypothetical protein [uncultured Ruegeria sp.]|uniref:hypothetical protein n=1 Tax=uncultured Ruegeria sp. TaxID=259304 RepID=UPI002621AE84|nr:hypothetical protein [uncultured Ruegeria sp.]